MKTTSKITLLLAAVGAAAIVIYVTRRGHTKANAKKMLNQVADEGYETASDILFPGKKIDGGHLHYGPVLPR
jgi:hypothetical protein